MKRKALKWMLRTLGVIFLLGLLGLWVFLRHFDQFLATQISNALDGADVVIGSSSLNLSHLQINSLKLALHDGSGRVSIQRVEAEWTWAGLQKNVLESLILTRPALEADVESPAPSPRTKPSETPAPFTVKSLKISEGEFRLGKNPWGIRSDPIHVTLTGGHYETGNKTHLEFDPKQCALRTENLAIGEGTEEIRVRKVSLGFPSTGKPVVLETGVLDLSLEIVAGQVEARGEILQSAKMEAHLRSDGVAAKLSGKLFPAGSRALLNYKQAGLKQEVHVELTQMPLGELAEWLPLKEAEGVADITLGAQWGKNGEQTLIQGKLQVVSSGDWTFLELGHHWTAPNIQIPFSLLPPQKWSRETFLAALTVRNATVQARRLDYGGSVATKEFSAKLSLLAGTLDAEVEAEIAPTGKLQLTAQGTLGTHPSLHLRGEVREIDLAKEADEYAAGTVELNLRGGAAVKADGTLEWDWAGERRPLWQSRGELILGPAFVGIPSQKMELEDLSVSATFSLKSSDKDLALTPAAQVHVGKWRIAGEENGAGLHLTQLTGAFPLDGADGFGRMRFAAALNIERLFAEGIAVTEVQCGQMVFENGHLQIPELKCGQVLYGEDLTAKQLFLRDLSVNGVETILKRDDPQWLKRVTLSTKASAEEFRYGKTTLTAARTQLNWGGGIFEAKDFHVSGNDTQFNLNLKCNFAETLSAELHGTIKELNLHRWAPEKIETFDVDGPMEGDVSVKVTGKDWAALELANVEIQLGSAKQGGKVFFVDNDWIRALKTGEPELAKVIFSTNNSIEYDQAKIQLGRIGNDIVGEYAFQGKTVAPTFTITYHDMTFAKLTKRLQQLMQVKTGK